MLFRSPQGVERRGPGFENQYACGYFPVSGDFRRGCTLGEFVPLDYGFDFYAPQTFADGNRRLLIGWMGMPDADYTNPTAAQGWQHCLTVPRELRWEDGGLRTRPAKELESLRGEARETVFSGGCEMEVSPMSDLLISCEGDLTLNLSGAELKAENGTLTLSVLEGGWGRSVRTAPAREPRSLRILADGCSLEVFANDGEAVLTAKWYPESSGRTLTLRGSGRLTVFDMKPSSMF